MRRIWIILLAVIFAGAFAVTPGFAKEKKEKKAQMEKAAKESRLSGLVIRSSKENSTLTVSKGGVERTVVYDSNTKWTKGTATIEMGEVKDGSRVIVMGKYDEKGRLMASRIDLRLR